MTRNGSPELDQARSHAEEVELSSMADRNDETTAEDPLISRDTDHEDIPAQVDSHSGGNAFVWALTISSCVSGLLFGYDTGVISSTLVSIGTDLSHRNLDTIDKSVITSAVSAFALIASPVAGVFADRIGRKNIIICSDLLFILGALWQAFTSAVWGMILGRAVVGLAIGGASLITPLYIGELAPSHLRGRLVTVSLLFITGGQVIAYLIGWAFSSMPGGWRWMVGLGSIPALVQVVLLFFMPETPRFLCKVHREVEAKTILGKIYAGTGDSIIVNDTMRAIKREILEEEEARLEATSSKSKPIILPSTLSFLLFHAPHARALTITCMLQGLQQLCGFNSLMYFSATIFSLLGFTSPTLISLSIALTNFIFTILAFYLIDRIGRRRILLLTIPIMAIALLLCAASFTLINLPHHSNVNTNPNTSAPSSPPPGRLPALAILASLILYVSSYATGLGPVPWQQSELFPLSVRSLGSSIATATNWGSNTIVGLTFLPMMEVLTPGWTFVCYAVICVVGWVVVWAIYPETMGLSLEEVGGLLKSGWGVREGEERRRRMQA